MPKLLWPLFLVCKATAQTYWPFPGYLCLCATWCIDTVGHASKPCSFHSGLKKNHIISSTIQQFCRTSQMFWLSTHLTKHELSTELHVSVCFWTSYRTIMTNYTQHLNQTMVALNVKKSFQFGNVFYHLCLVRYWSVSKLDSCVLWCDSFPMLLSRPTVYWQELLLISFHIKQNTTTLNTDIFFFFTGESRKERGSRLKRLYCGNINLYSLGSHQIRSSYLHYIHLWKLKIRQHKHGFSI